MRGAGGQCFACVPGAPAACLREPTWATACACKRSRTRHTEAGTGRTGWNNTRCGQTKTYPPTHTLKPPFGHAATPPPLAPGTPARQRATMSRSPGFSRAAATLSLSASCLLTASSVEWVPGVMDTST